MKHIKEQIDIIPEEFKSLGMYLDNKRYAVLDIETTGLSPIHNQVMLVGLIVVEDKKVTLHQFFATDLQDEAEILSKTAKELSSCNYIVTFNGRFFDIPFIEKRNVKHGVYLERLFNLDLFYLLKFYSDIPKIIPKLNQKSIEMYAGIDVLRQDRISGGESVALFSEYLNTGSMDLEKRILLHNSDDLKQLLRLMGLLKNVDIHRSFFKTGFPIDGGRLSGIDLKKTDLIIKGFGDNPTEYIAFPSVEAPYSFRMSAKDGAFEIELPCEKRNKDIYVDIGFIESKGLDELKEFFPSFINDYLIIKENGSINYPEVNLMSKFLAIDALGRLG